MQISINHSSSSHKSSSESKKNIPISFDSFLKLQRNEAFEGSFSSKYKIEKVIGEGSFGKVQEVSSMSNLTKYAAKESAIPSTKSALFNEKYVLDSIVEEEGFPRLKEFMNHESSHILIMTLLGENLLTLHEKCGGKFSLKTIAMIGMQAVNRLEVLHEKGFLHRDIKPENFVIGLDSSNENIIHLIDFGLSSRFQDKDGEHIPFSRNEKVVGTFYYLSVYEHLGIQASRRDDLISLGYMLLHLFYGKMLWLENFSGNNEERKKAFLQEKATTPLKKLCKGIPELILYFEHVLQLKFKEKPNYKFLESIFSNMLHGKDFPNDGKFDWKDLKSNKGIDLQARKIFNNHLNNYKKEMMESKIEQE